MSRLVGEVREVAEELRRLANVANEHATELPIDDSKDLVSLSAILLSLAMRLEGKPMGTAAREYPPSFGAWVGLGGDHFDLMLRDCYASMIANGGYPEFSEATYERMHERALALGDRWVATTIEAYGVMYKASFGVWPK